MQTTAGAVGGAVEGATDNPYLGLGASLATPLPGAGFRAGRRALSRRGVPADRQKLINLVADLGKGDLQKGAAIAQARLRAGGPDTALVDVLGIKGQRLTRGAGGAGGRASQTIDDFVQGRIGTRGGRLQAAADEIAPNSFYGRLKGLNELKRRDAKPLYDEAFAPRSDVAGKLYAPWDARLQQFLDDPLVKKGMAKGIRDQQLEALAAGRPFNFQEFAVRGFDDAGDLIIGGTPNLRAMDAAKRGMDDMINAARDANTGNIQWTTRLRAVDQVRRALVDKLDDMTTDSISGRSAYKEARAAWAGPSQLEDAAWAGRKFLRGDVEQTVDRIARMSATEREAFRLGARREISKMIDTDTQSAVTKFAAKKHDLWNKIKVTFGDDVEGFRAYQDDVFEEISKARTEQFIGQRAGSHTTPLAQDVADLARVPQPALDVAANAATLNWRGLASNALKSGFNRLSAPNQEVAGKLARALTETDPRMQAQILEQLNRAGVRLPTSQGGGKLTMDLLRSIGVAQGAGTALERYDGP